MPAAPGPAASGPTGCQQQTPLTSITVPQQPVPTQQHPQALPISNIIPPARRAGRGWEIVDRIVAYLSVLASLGITAYQSFQAGTANAFAHTANVLAQTANEMARVALCISSADDPVSVMFRYARYFQHNRVVDCEYKLTLT